MAVSFGTLVSAVLFLGVFVAAGWWLTRLVRRREQARQMEARRDVELLAEIRDELRRQSDLIEALTRRGGP